jgi:hypothetical protein
MEGEGFNLIVHPERYNIVSKTFKKKKGIEIQLSPEEISLNKEEAPKMEGSGIFGRKFDDFVRDTIGTKAKDIIYKGADKVKPLVQAGIKKAAELAPEAGASALSAAALAIGQPELVPFAQMAGRELGRKAGQLGSSFAVDYLDNPEKYQGYKTGVRNGTAPATLQGAVAQNEALGELNKETGTKYGNLARASIGNMEAHKRRAELQAGMVRQDRREPVEGSGMGYGLYAGGGLYAGAGLYASGRAGSGMGRHKEGIIGRGGGFVASRTSLPPALQSQPFGSNFQFQHTLPPAYQKFSRGGVYA